MPKLSYIHESGLSAARRRRHRRAAITLTLVALMLVGGFGYAVAYYEGWVGDQVRASAAPTPTCTPKPGQAKSEQGLAPSQVTVNVYNATRRPGLANETAQTLRAQGFDVATVSNDPLRKQVRGVGEIRYGASGKAAAKLAASRLKGARLVLDGRTDDSVDVVIGARFKRLSVPPASEQAAASSHC